MSLRKATWLSQATIIILGLTGCATSSQHIANSNEIVIGVVGPMSTDLAAFGAQERRGVEMAVQDINAAGGLLGHKLWMAVGDDQCNPSKAVSVAHDMVDQHAALVVGHFCSGSSIPASAIYAAAQIVQITPASTNPRLTDEGAAAGWTTLFRVANPDDRQGIFAADWLAKTHPHAKVVVLNDGSNYGLSVSDRLLSEMKATGTTPVLTASYQQRSSDHADLVAAIKKAQADFVYIAGYHDDFAKIIKQARASGVTATFIGIDALNTSEFASLAGTAADGVRFTDTATPDELESAKQVVAEFHAAGKDSVGFAMAGYAAVQAWATGVKRAGTIDAVKVAAAIRSAPVDTVLGRLSWDAKGDIEQLRYAWYIWHGSQYTQEPAE